MSNQARKDGEIENYDDYLLAMKRIQQQTSRTIYPETTSPRDRYRNNKVQRQGKLETDGSGSWSAQQATVVGSIASMVPDEIIYKHSDYTMRSYDTALMFIDVSGFTDLCENYTKPGRGGPSRLTQVLNAYIGAMVQEIMTHNGDILNFSGDAFLSMWKKSSTLSMQDVVHTAIDCGLIIQKNYGTFMTDVGVVLKVKVAISAGRSHFSIIGGKNVWNNYVIVGQPVWDVKIAEYMSTAGDVITSASAWRYVNEAEYCTQPCGDGLHTKVLGVGTSWKRVDAFHGSVTSNRAPDLNNFYEKLAGMSYREFSLRPAVISALRSTWWPALRRFMVTPVLLAVDNDEPMEFLTEIRRVVVVFLNIITKTVTEDVLIKIVDTAYKCVCSVTSEAGGLVNKVSMFDKDMMFLVVFGMRGLKHEYEAEKALQCSYELKEKLNDSNIISVSIGITSGTTYCGVVGHVLRREYTVIGSAVNKAARLMMAYPNIITCDKETFLKSKLSQKYFKLMEYKFLKGIPKPGPIYEFNKLGWNERVSGWRHPLLGRNEELRSYKSILHNAMEQYGEKFTRYKDHKFSIAFLGPRLVGKTRLLDECLHATPSYIQAEKILISANEKEPFAMFRKLMSKSIFNFNSRNSRASNENVIRYSMDTSTLKPLEIHALNSIFDCRFPLPENFSCDDNFLNDFGVKNVLKEFIKKNLTTFRVVAILEAQHTDEESWRLLLMLLECKAMLVVLSITDDHKMSDLARDCLANDMILKMRLNGIDRWYHAALTCQLLDVEAIPPDLEKVVECASGGMPGWIQNFVISLVQRGVLTITTVSRAEAVASGAVMPATSLLQRSDCDLQNDSHFMRTSRQSIYSLISLSMKNREGSKQAVDPNTVQIAVIGDSYTFEDIKVDMTMDAVILKTYDSLTSFEKMILKCGSVLGDVFTRRMLLHLLQSDSQRKVAMAVAKLFTIRVLECEGGDFTRDSSLVFVRSAPALPPAESPYCACIGTAQTSDCRDLPIYAFCGYMKFRNSLFRTTTYDLLTENQKGLILESEELKHTRQQIQTLSEETRLPIEHESSLPFHNYTSNKLAMRTDMMYLPSETSSYALEEMRNPNDSFYKQNKDKEVRSFSSLELGQCECLQILLSVYSQIIDHCRGADDYEKLFIAYMEYADLCIIDLNIPQAVRLLTEVEEFVKSNKLNDKPEWMKDFRLANIHSLQGLCMLESGATKEARKELFYAMKLYYDPFPVSKHAVKFKDIRATFSQMMAMYIVPNLYMARSSGHEGYYYENIAKTLNRLYRLFTECKEPENASLAAKWSLNYALRTNSNFRLLCSCYGNMIDSYRQTRWFSLCIKLEDRAMQLCRRKRGRLDVTEVQSVCYLYTNLFLFYVKFGKKIESLKFGLSVMHMMTSLTELNTWQMLILWMLKFLLSELRIHDMVAVMREFFYMTNHYDLSLETWYYFYAIVILLDTGYSVESYSTCEKFYIKKGDAILRSKTPEAAWNFFTCMWLVTIRVGAWERSILWEDKIKQIVCMKFPAHEFSVMILVRLVEGLLITLVREMDNRNINMIVVLQKSIKTMMQDVKSACVHVPVVNPRYFLLLAYYNCIRGKKQRAYNFLNKSIELSKQYSHATVLYWAEHTRDHWKGTLSPKLENYWTEHIEPPNHLDYRDFDPEEGKIIPYTLPLPVDLDS